jgi:PAS domain S-box-containing protein
VPDRDGSGLSDAEARIATLIRTIAQAEQELLDLTGGKVDAVVSPAGETYLLHDAQDRLVRSEEHARISAEAQRAILDALPTHLAIVDAHGIVRTVNSAWRRYAAENGNTDPDFSVGRDYLEVADRALGSDGDVATHVGDALRKVLRGELDEFAAEYPCHSPTQQRWFRAMIAPVPLEHARGAVVMHLDVTERRLANESLRQSEERFRGMFEHAPSGITILDPAGRFVRVNPAYAEMHRESMEALIGRSLVDVAHPDDGPITKQLLDEVSSGRRESFLQERRFLRADGSIAWGRISISAVRDEAGAIISMIGIKQEITEQRMAEQALHASRELMEIAGRMGRIGGWSVQVPPTEVQWSDEVCAIYEVPAGTIPSLAEAFAFFTTESRSVAESAFAKCMSEGRGFDVELQLVTARGTRRWVRAIGQAGRDAHGRITSARGALQDITEQKALEQQFLRAQRMESVGTLAGGIAHDLNNVFTPIVMAVDLLKSFETDPEKVAILSSVEASTHRGVDLVRQVLTFARGTEGRRVEVQVRHLVAEVGKIVHETFPKSVEFVSAVPSSLWTVSGDPTQLHQVLVNLCVNARDAMPHGGRLTVTLAETQLDAQYAGMTPEAKPGPYVVIDVEDTGTGIPPEVMDRIFDPFFTTKELGKGTGLGLSTSAAIIKSHAGFIRCYSEVGKGSRFRIYLPANTESASAPRDTEHVALPRGNGETILVVDDESAVRDITRQTLEAFGYRVLVATDGADGVAVFASNRAAIALVLSDVMMPVMDGPTMVEVLTRMAPDVRVLAASGLHANAHSRQTSGANVRGFLPKPYSAVALLTAIRAALAD